MITAISKDDFRKNVIDVTTLSIVKFGIEWNGANQIITPLFQEMAETYKSSAAFFSVDVEIEKGIDQEYGVMEIPTILFFHNGQLIDHVTGLVPKDVIKAKIENAIKEMY